MSATPSHAATPTTPRIAIIGGGISGLAAAHRLAELLPNANLSLFEATGRLGGVLDTAHRSGFLIERSADNFLTQPPTAVDLCEQLGMTGELLSTDRERRRAFVVRDGRLLPIPDGFYLMSPRKLWPLLTSPLLSSPAKLRLLAEPFIPRKKPSSSGSKIRRDGRGQGEGSSDESVADFARRRLGREAFEQIVQPLVAGIYTADPEQLSMAATMPQFLEMERTHGSLLRATLRSRRTGHFSDQSPPPPPHAEADQASGPRYALFTAPTRGLTSFINALAATQRVAGAIQLSSPITSISRECNQWRLDCGLRIADYGLNSPNPQSEIRNPQFVDALILAVPAQAAARLVESTDPTLAAELAAIPYASCAVVSFGFARRQIGHALDGFGFVVPQREGRRIIAASFASLKYPGRAPHDCVLIRTFLGGALQPHLLNQSDVDLIRTALEELSQLLSVTGEPLVTDVARWPNSMPQYHVGHLDRVTRIEQLASRWPNLALAGNAYHGVGIPQCIASGQAAAERLAASLCS